MLVIRLLSIVALAIAITWVAKKPGYDSWTAATTALAALAATYIPTKKEAANQKQNLKGDGTAIQAGGNITIGNPPKSPKEDGNVK